MKKIVSLILALCLVLALVPAMAETAPFELNVCVASEPETIDPNLANSVDAAMMTNHQFECLMKYVMTDENLTED